MSANGNDTTPTPDLTELLQLDEPPAMSTVPVRIVESVQSWALPNRRVRIDEQLCDDTQWIQLIDGSKKRARATFIATGQPMRIRVSTSGVGMIWPLGVPYVVTHTQAVFVQSGTPGQSVTVGVTEEFWAD